MTDSPPPERISPAVNKKGKSDMKKMVSLFALCLGTIGMAGILIYDIVMYNSGLETEILKTMTLYNMRGIIIIISLAFILTGIFFAQTRKRRTVVNILFLFPLIFTFLITVILPFILGIGYSMTDWTGIKVTRFLGFDNYLKIFRSTDYIYSFAVTFIFTIINMLSVNIVAFCLALLCTGKLKGKNIYRAAFFVPNLIGGIVLGYVWQFLFNKVFTMIFDGTDSMLSNPNMAILAIIIVSTWQYAGYIMMIYVTGLQGMPKDVVEASCVDGANAWQSLRHITIPMIANTFTICIFLTLVNSFKQFDLNFAITNGGPSRVVGEKAIFATEFLALNIYKTAITRNEYAMGQAKAVIFFIILAIISLTQVSINKKKEVEM